MSEIRIFNLCHKKPILVDIYRQSLLTSFVPNLGAIGSNANFCESFSGLGLGRPIFPGAEDDEKFENCLSSELFFK